MVVFGGDTLPTGLPSDPLPMKRKKQGEVGSNSDESPAASVVIFADSSHGCALSQAALAP